MLRLRPVLSSLALAAFCAALQGATVAKIEADAGWAQSTAILQILTLPLAAICGLILGFSASATALRARGAVAGGLCGLGIFLAPALAALAPELPLQAAGWAGLVGWVAACRWWMGRPAPPPERAGPGPLALGAGLAGLLVGAVGLVHPGPQPAIGSVPSGGPVVDALDQRPNLALVVLDTLRADRLGCYGYPRPTTPFLDELAAGGIRYTRAIAPGTHTPPSHASLFTGVAPSAHGVMGTRTGMPAPVDTLASRLVASGYTTVGVAANFVLRRARRFSQGFLVYDDSLVCHRGLGAASMAVTRLAAVGRLVGQLPLGRHTPAKYLAFHFRPSQEPVRAEQVNARAFTHLEQAAAAPRPWFLFLNYMDVHSPFQAPGEHFDRFLENDPGPFRERLGGLEFHQRLRPLSEEVRAGSAAHDEVLAALGDRYDGELAYLDEQLRALAAQLEQVSGDRGWLLLVTSDHGEHFGEHDEVGHGGAPWQQVVHVPLIVAGSGVRPALVEQTVSLLAVPGTLLAAAGAREPLGTGGILPGLPEELLQTAEAHRNEGGAGARPLAEQGDPEATAFFPPLQRVAAFDGSWKHWLLVGPDGTLSHEASFDLDADPGEQHPLTGAAAGAENGLVAGWRRWWQALYLEGRSRSAESGAGGDEAQLAELGYAGGDDFEPAPPAGEQP